VSDRTCQIEACGKRVHGRGLCPMHYRKWRLYGDPLASRLRVQKPCIVDGCPRFGRIKGLCEKHHGRLSRNGTTSFVGQPPGPQHPNWRGRDIRYAAAHRRVKMIRGSARLHTCEWCGAPARDWAYNHLDPNEMSTGRLPYSTDPAYYLPLCVFCHRALDREHRQARSN
jgi:hypothetical protein